MIDPSAVRSTAKKNLPEQVFFGSQATKIYIMPPMSGGARIADLSSGISATIVSVAIIKPAMDAAFCNAARATLAGSRIPISIISPYSPVAALQPVLPLLSTTLLSATDASSPELATICRSGSLSARHAILMPCVLVFVVALDLSNKQPIDTIYLICIQTKEALQCLFHQSLMSI